MEFVILTGLSGAGKGRAKSILSDFGYYCVDNMPAELIWLMVELAGVSPERYERVALVVDARSNRDFDPLLQAIEHMQALNVTVNVLFLEAQNEYIVRRYKETRRRHPLDQEYPVLEEAIEAERLLLAPLHNCATTIVDTTDLSANRLTELFGPLFGQNGGRSVMITEIRTFGFKRGLPLEADLVFDVRFLPNPFYVSGLKALTGRDQPVSDFVMAYPASHQFLHKLCEMMDFLIPQYQAEGRQKLVIAIGCTGGKHRSVAIAEQLGQYLERQEWTYLLTHRDMEK